MPWWYEVQLASFLGEMCLCPGWFDPSSVNIRTKHGPDEAPVLYFPRVSHFVTSAHDARIFLLIRSCNSASSHNIATSHELIQTFDTEVSGLMRPYEAIE